MPIKISKYFYIFTIAFFILSGCRISDTAEYTNTGITSPNALSSVDLYVLYLEKPARFHTAWMLSRPFKDAYAFDAFLERYLDENETAELYKTVFLVVDVNEAPGELLITIPNISRGDARTILANKPYHSDENLFQFLISQFGEARAKTMIRYMFVENGKKSDPK